LAVSLPERPAEAAGGDGNSRGQGGYAQIGISEIEFNLFFDFLQLRCRFFMPVCLAQRTHGNNPERR